MKLEINLIKHKSIDIKKYDVCLDMANAPIYPYSWYLNIVASKNWNLLIYGDYDYVMPIPFGRSRKTFFQNRYGQPAFCQQLGIYSKNGAQKEIVEEFLKVFFKLKPFKYNFNVFNTTILRKVEGLNERFNYYLELNKPYNVLFRNFYNSKRGHFRKAEREYDWQINETKNLDEFIQFKIHHTKYEHQFHKTKTKETLQKILETNIGTIYQAKVENELLACIFILKHKNRIYNMLSESSELGKRASAMLYLLNFLFKKYSNSNFVFDFKGSNTPGVQSFFKELGAEVDSFYQYRNE